ncbi:tetratricopeptide repeat protein [Colwellia sp. KU-HH00111]|uniref:tetratricopeptide repeat protein n=1 Tax=Colwellia sp. KU-HH00111 TaxID=3127652 RepID=UPI0033653C8C
MKDKRMMMSLLIFLLIGVSSSSFFLNAHLTKLVTSQNYSEAQFDYALAQNNFTALSVAWQQTVVHSEPWVVLATKLAKTQGEAAYQLALFYQEVYQKDDQEQPVQAIFWYKNAIRLNHHPAFLALAQLYFQQQQFDKAQAVLAQLPTELTDTLANEALMLEIQLTIHQANLNKLSQLIANYQGQLQTTVAGQALLTNIKKYQVLSFEKRLVAVNADSISCDNSIQLFATNLKHLNALEQLIDDFKTQPLSRSLCFTPVRYLPKTAIDCSTTANKAISCDELSWEALADTIDTRYVGLMLPQGGANVHLGILYFDAEDNIDVFTHEISHLLGFVDEYPLNEHHARCQSSQEEAFSSNIAVLKKRYQGDRVAVRQWVLKQISWGKQIKTTTPILQPTTSSHGQQYWQLGTPEAFKNQVGLFTAQTCDNTTERTSVNFSAFKPLYQRTKLQYYALDFPSLYLQLLQTHKQKYLMPSFHYNIALAYFKQDNIALAHYWLKQSAVREVDHFRRKKTRLGQF